MELILISDSKLKIMLSQKDMIKYDLCCEDIDYSNTETRRAFWNILDEAKQKTGFDAAREKIYIQVFPLRLGGCEIFVTKLEPRKEECDLDIDIIKEEKPSVYRFSKLSHLLSVCRVLSSKGYRGESSAYHNGKSFFLVISHDQKIIEEYADLRENNNYIYHILEHCSSICAKDAVKTLAPLC